MTLPNVWFAIVVIFWVGYFILDGFDLGVGMLQAVLPHDEQERRILINSIGPVWDGNEVWLVVAGAATFAAFPAWYGTMFSALYLAVFVILMGLMLRGVSFEYRRKVEHAHWLRGWTWAMAAGSAIVPLLLGVGLGDLLHGLPIDQAGNFTGNFGDILLGYGFWFGITLVALSLLMGITYLGLKTTGALLDRVTAWSRPISAVAFLTVLGFVVWTHAAISKGVLPNFLEVVALLGAIGAVLVSGSKEHAGWTFVSAAVAMGSTVASLFIELFPNVMVSSTNHAYNLTVTHTASTSYSLTVMTVVAVIFLPIVLLYQGWSFHVFRKRLASPPAPGAPDGTPPDGTPPAVGATPAFGTERGDGQSLPDSRSD